jgi:uncharacterized protein YlxP (DUF503 family)
VIASLFCECIFYEAQSLKDKRAVLQRILTRLRQRYNVSVAEIGYQDLWQRAEIAIVSVSSSRVACERELQKALEMMDSFPEIERTITRMEWY